MKKQKDYLFLILTAVCWIGAFLLWGFKESITQWLMEKIFYNFTSVGTAAAMLLSGCYIVLVYSAFVLFITGMTRMFFSKGLLECAAVQMHSYFAVFYMLPLILVRVVWSFLWAWIPAIRFNLMLELLYIKKIFVFTGVYAHTIFSIVFVLLGFSVICGVFGVWKRMKTAVNVIGGLLCLPYLYTLLYCVFSNFYYCKWLLVVIGFIYAVNTALLLYFKIKVRTPLSPVCEFKHLFSDEGLQYFEE